MDPPEREILKVPRSLRAGPPRVSQAVIMASSQAPESENSCKSIRQKSGEIPCRSDSQMGGLGLVV